MKPQQDHLMNSPAGRLVFGWAVGIVAIGVVTVLIDLAGYVDFLDIRRGPTKEQLQNVFVLKSLIAGILFVLIVLTGNHLFRRRR